MPAKWTCYYGHRHHTWIGAFLCAFFRRIKEKLKITKK